eukprot:767527-Hanusia_phi.AAC.3
MFGDKATPGLPRTFFAMLHSGPGKPNCFGEMNFKRVTKMSENNICHAHQHPRLRKNLQTIDTRKLSKRAGRAYLEDEEGHGILELVKAEDSLVEERDRDRNDAYCMSA